MSRSKMKSDLECSVPAFKKRACCKNAKGTKCRPLTVFRPRFSCLKFLHLTCFLYTGLEHSMSNLVFEIDNKFIFGMLYSIQDLQNPFSFLTQFSILKIHPLALEVYQLAEETFIQPENGIKERSIILYCIR